MTPDEEKYYLTGIFDSSCHLFVEDVKTHPKVILVFTSNCKDVLEQIITYFQLSPPSSFKWRFDVQDPEEVEKILKVFRYRSTTRRNSIEAADKVLEFAKLLPDPKASYVIQSVATTLENFAKHNGVGRRYPENES